jgi:hypothetical protein
MALWKTAGQAVDRSVRIVGTLLFLLGFSWRIAIFRMRSPLGEEVVKFVRL